MIYRRTRKVINVHNAHFGSSLRGPKKPVSKTKVAMAHEIFGLLG